MPSIWTRRGAYQDREPAGLGNCSELWGAKAAGGSLAGKVPIRASSSERSRRSISSASVRPRSSFGAFFRLRLMNFFC